MYVTPTSRAQLVRPNKKYIYFGRVKTVLILVMKNIIKLLEISVMTNKGPMLLFTSVANVTKHHHHNNVGGLQAAPDITINLPL